MAAKRLFLPTGMIHAFENRLNGDLQKLRRQVAQGYISKRTAKIKGEQKLKTHFTKVNNWIKRTFKRKGVELPDLDFSDDLTEAIKEWEKLVNLM